MFLRKFLVVFLICSSFAHAMDGPPDTPPSHPGTQLKVSESSINEEQVDYKNSELNLKWLNPQLDPEQESLFPKGKEESLQDMVAGWVRKNMDLKFSINVWYKSKTTSPKALAKTQNALNALLLEDYQKVTFRDTCDIASTSVFDNQNIYFEADAVRMAIALRHGHHKDPSLPRYVFYSDLNIPPVSLSALFTDKTRIAKLNKDTLKGILDKYGFALPVNNAVRPMYENSFLALDSQHEIAVQALKFGILEINQKRAEFFAREKCWTTWTESDIWSKSQIVFKSFPTMMNYYKYLTGEYGICDEDKLGGDPDKMPKTLQGKKAEFPFPEGLFGLTTSSMTRQCKYAKDGQRCLYIVTSESNLSELTIQMDKPISGFYFSRPPL